MRRLLRSFVQDESGATAMEYGLIVCLISVALIGIMGAIGTNMGGTFNTVSNTLKRGS